VNASVRITEGDRYPIVFPFTHVGGIQMLVLQMLTGCSSIVFDHFDPLTTPELMGQLGTTLLAGRTPLAVLLLARQREHRERALLPDLRAVFTGAAPKPPDLHSALRREMGGLGTLSCYGLTEAPMGVLNGGGR
jgi:cyclohexanecarboxylate-CoA ligase